jgi:hypothetical protein
MASTACISACQPSGRPQGIIPTSEICGISDIELVAEMRKVAAECGGLASDYL